MKLISIITLLSVTLVSLNAFGDFDQDHTKFTVLLKTYTKNSNLQTSVDYKKLKAQRAVLTSYIKDLTSVSSTEFKKFKKDEKLAFWINVYNAYTLDLILDHYPLKSIKDIGGIFGTSPWKRKIVKVLGKKLTLNNVEHDIIRKEFSEPRIHFAVNCASIGCPSLLREAFTASKLESQLTLSSQNFLNNSSKNHFKKGTLYLSKIFDWYGDDFKEKHGGHINYVKKFYKINKDVRVKFLNYDWKLNDY